MLQEPVTIQSASSSAVDETNDATTGYSAGTDVLGKLEQRSAQEVTSGRDTLISDFVLYLFPDVVVTAYDRVVDRFGRTFEVVGTPNMQSRPGSDHHLVVNLRFVA